MSTKKPRFVNHEALRTLVESLNPSGPDEKNTGCVLVTHVLRRDGSCSVITDMSTPNGSERHVLSQAAAQLLDYLADFMPTTISGDLRDLSGVIYDMGSVRAISRDQGLPVAGPVPTPGETEH